MLNQILKMDFYSSKFIPLTPNVLVLLLAYGAVGIESLNVDSLLMYFKLATPIPARVHDNMSLISHLTISVCKALPYF